MKKFLMSLCAMLAMAGSTFADDTFSVDDFLQPKTASAQLVVRYSLDEGSDCSGYNFRIQLPAELEFVVDDLGDPVYTAGDCYTGAPSITPNIDGGYLKVGCVTANTNPLNKQEGILVSFMVKVKSGATVTADQVLTGHLIDGVISNEGGQTHSVADSDFTITITDRVILNETSTLAPMPATDVNVSVNRTINANQWSTICLPFDMNATQILTAFGEDAEILYFDSFSIEGTASNVTKIILNFEAIDFEDGLEKNYPYLIRVSNKVTEILADNVTIEPDEVLETFTKGSGSNKLKGEFIGTYEAETIIPEKGLFLSNNEFWYSIGLTKIKAFRCYLLLNRVLADYSADTGAPVFISIGGETTRLDQLNIDNDDDNYYTLDGRAVKTPGKGVYIHRGKKIIIK